MIRRLSEQPPLTREDVISSLRHKTLPTELLYDENGLQLFEEITFQEDYYLTGAEISILERHCDHIAKRLSDCSVIVELGSGNLRKTRIILEALDRLGAPFTYLALDLDKKELDRSMGELQSQCSFKNIQVSALQGTYEEARGYLAKMEQRKAILWLGSSAGNMDREAASKFLLSYTNEALNPHDRLLIGLDHRNDPRKISKAYDDSNGSTRRFTMNGLTHANRLLGREAFRDDCWEFLQEYDDQGGFNQAGYLCCRDTRIGDVDFVKGDRIIIERSFKYSKDEAEALLGESRLSISDELIDPESCYSLYIAFKPDFKFELDPVKYAQNPVPSMDEWLTLWKTWDLITTAMIPQKLRLEKPIDLRHPCIFYMGHIPTFLDINLAKVTSDKGPSDGKSLYWEIFERGIDPHVDDPDQCHEHSTVPTDWPPFDEIMGFRDAVRRRLLGLYDSGEVMNRQVGRAVWMCYEHEAMHAETLLYMLLQSTMTIPPESPKPMWDPQEPLAPAKWIQVPATTIVDGMNDPEGAGVSSQDGFFGWDIEKPRSLQKIGAFEAMNRPITNNEFASFLKATNSDYLPASWKKTNGDVYVRSIFGPLSFEIAGNWPVHCSQKSLKQYAEWSGQGRLPTIHELRSFYDHASRRGGARPNEYYSKSSDSEKGLNITEQRHELFRDLRLDDYAISFRKWHPKMLQSNTDLQIYTGVWEWSDSPFGPKDGFIASELYPGYSSDFFDGLHYHVYGGSWATISRLAGRSTFTNWFQDNYEYAWCGARLVRN